MVLGSLNLIAVAVANEETANAWQAWWKMKAKDLIKLLRKHGDKEVVIAIKNNDGCDTCGHGATTSERRVSQVVDLETRVVLEPDSY